MVLFNLFYTSHLPGLIVGQGKTLKNINAKLPLSDVNDKKH